MNELGALLLKSFIIILLILTFIPLLPIWCCVIWSWAYERKNKEVIK